MRKKILVVLMILTLVLSMFTACGDTKKSKNMDAIKPVAKDPVNLFVAAFEGNIELKRVDTDRFDNAEALLLLAYECLENNGITDATISDLYSVPLGFASMWFSCDAYIIYHDKDATNQMVMVVLKDEDGLTLIGSFKVSEVKDNDWHVKLNEVLSSYESTIMKKFGLDKADMVIQFPFTKLKKVEQIEATKEHSDLYEKTSAAYNRIALPMWVSDEMSADGMYVKIKEEGVNSFATLKKYIGKYFNENVTNDLFNLVTEQDVYPKYKEKDGSLYAVSLGMGGPFGLESISVKLVGTKGENELFVVLEAKFNDFDDDMTKVISTTYYEHLIQYVKVEGEWKCSSYVDIPFGLYETLF